MNATKALHSKQQKRGHSKQLLGYFFLAAVVGFFVGVEIKELTLASVLLQNLPNSSSSSTSTLLKVSGLGTMFRDACNSRPTTDMSTQLVEAEAVGISFRMDLYDFGGGVMDIVSRAIARDKAWEKLMTEEMMAVFPCIDGMDCKEGSSFTSRHGTLLDVGANIGWYSIVAAHLGHNVISFEPFSRNVDLICSSKEHLKEEKKQNWHLFELGLDFRQRQCQLFQQKAVNIGDTHSICDKKTREYFIKHQYEPLGWMNTTTLDYALQEGIFDQYPRIDVMKIDVEGFESFVLAGANAFFESKFTPSYIFMEFTSRTVETQFGADALDYMKSILIHLKNHGYELQPRTDQIFRLSIRNNTIDEILKQVINKDLLFVREARLKDLNN